MSDGAPSSSPRYMGGQAVVEGTARKDNYREFMIEYADFQPMYEPGSPVCPSQNSSKIFDWSDPARVINPPGRVEAGLPDLYSKPKQCPVPDGSATFLPPPCPEATVPWCSIAYRSPTRTAVPAWCRWR